MRQIKRILVAEDDRHIREGLLDALELEGFETSGAENGREALKFYNDWQPDLILLDIMMPVKSGYDVCREIRRGNQAIPIIMLTAKGEEIDKVLGLELGADDYICKPFGLRELMARINAALRRAELSGVASTPAEDESDAVMQFGDVTINAETMCGEKAGEAFEITKKELTILTYFWQHRQKVIKRNDLLAYVWGPEYHSFTRTLDQTIANLRKKIEADTRQPIHIKTVYGIGYKFLP